MKNKGGRQWFDGKEISKVKADLEYAYSRGYTLTETVTYCRISESGLLRYLKANEGFRRRLAGFKKTQNMKSKDVVYDEIQKGDLMTAKWYLEHKDNEFRKVPVTKKGSVEIGKGKDGDIARVKFTLVETEEQANEFNNRRNRNSDNEGI